MAKLTDHTEQTGYHPIRIAAQYSGLSAEVIRAWERRYHVIAPKRNKSGQRVYSNSDIKRLSLFAKAVETGRRISDLAGLMDDELLEIVERDQVLLQKANPQRQRKSTALVMEYFDMCVEAIHKFDLHSLMTTLDKAEVELSTIFFIEDLVDPLMSYTREECRRGTITNEKQHWLFSAITGCLTWLSGKQASYGQQLVAYATKSDVELIGLKAAATANSLGWNTIYFSQLISPQEVAASFNTLEPRLLIVSYSTKADYDYIPNQFRTLRALLPHALIVAQTAASQLPIVREVNAIHCGSLQQLQLELGRLNS